MKAKNVHCFSIFFLFAAFCVSIAVPQELPEYTTAEAKRHFGEVAIVIGRVHQVKHHIPLESDKKEIIFFNIDGVYPNQPFTLVLFEKYFSKFSKIETISEDLRRKYEGRRIKVKGKIVKYRKTGQPQIYLTCPEQIISVNQ